MTTKHVIPDEAANQDEQENPLAFFIGMRNVMLMDLSVILLLWLGARVIAILK
jgi:7-cyano-7-deazaguanine synthase in queuosine biosynthesis